LFEKVLPSQEPHAGQESDHADPDPVVAGVPVSVVETFFFATLLVNKPTLRRYTTEYDNGEQLEGKSALVEWLVRTRRFLRVTIFTVTHLKILNNQYTSDTPPTNTPVKSII
jgi:hypothetical protein